MSEKPRTRMKAPFTATEKAILAAIAAVVLLIAGVLGVRTFRYRRETPLWGPQDTTAIYIAPDNAATRAAAEYLAGAVREKLGIEPRIVTEKEDNGHCFSMLAGTESAGDPGENEEEMTAPDYLLTLEQDGPCLRTQGGSRCFGAVRAIAERWLQEDCGLRREGELRISRAMIAEKLSALSTEIPGRIKILSQNLCYSDDGPGRSVTERAERFLQLVEKYEPDLIGIQEGGSSWNAPLLEGLGDRYELFGFPKNSSDPIEGSWNAILYRKDRFTPEDGGLIWLSNTPTVSHTKLNYIGAYRLCNWALLTDAESGKTLLYSNTHLQNDGVTANPAEIRTREAEILLWKLRNDNMLATYPGFLTGDFNGTNDEPFYSLVTSYYADSRDTAITNSSSVDYSYQGYGSSGMLIDYCFHSPKNVTVLDYRILDDLYGGDYVSDHYGLLVTAVVH